MKNNNPLGLPSQPIDWTKLPPDEYARHLAKLDKKARKELELDRKVAEIAKALGQELQPKYIKP